MREIILYKEAIDTCNVILRELNEKMALQRDQETKRIIESQMKTVRLHKNVYLERLIELDEHMYEGIVFDLENSFSRKL